MSDASIKTIFPEQPRARTLADRAYDLLSDAIVHGELPLGERISELALSKRFAISRGPLREALRRLEGRKLVVVKPNVGARVVSLTTRDIVELYQIREALEALACQLATERMTDEELDQLESLLLLHEQNPDDGRASSRTSEVPDFHTAIAHGSKSNQLIEVLCGEFFDLLRVYRFRSSGASGRTPMAFQEHREIVTAMRLRDAEKASTLMRHHVRQSRLNVLRREGMLDLFATS